MVILFTATHLAAGTISDSDVEDIVRVYVDGYGPAAGAFLQLGYASKEEAVGHIGKSVREYAASGLPQWSTTLLKRLRLAELPDRPLQAQLLAGAVQFARNLQGMVAVLKDRADEAHS
jgi:hypothetical protein